MDFPFKVYTAFLCVLCFVFALGLYSCQETPAPQTPDYEFIKEMAADNPAEALRQANHYTEMAEERGDVREQVRGQQLSAWVQGQQQDMMAAFMGYLDAYNTAQAGAVDEFTVYQLLQLGILAQELNNPGMARGYYQQVLAVYDEGHSTGQANFAGKAAMYLGGLEGEKNPKEALRYTKRAMELLSAPRLQAENLINEGRVLLSMRDFEKAKISFDRAASLHEGVAFQVDYEKAHVLWYSGERAAAVSAFEAMEMRVDQYKDWQRFTLYEALGKLYQLEGSGMAIEYYMMAERSTAPSKRRRTDLLRQLVAVKREDNQKYIQELQALQTVQIESLRQMNKAVTAQALSQQVRMSKEKFIFTKALEKKAQMNWYLAAVIAILLVGGIFLHLMLKNRAVNHMRGLEANAQNEVIRTVIQQMKETNYGNNPTHTRRNGKH